MVSSQPLLANSGLMEIPALGELMLPPCGTKPGVYWGYASYYIGGVLIGYGTWWLLLFPPPLPQYPFCLRQWPDEWRFCVSESVPVSVSGSDLGAHVNINLSGMCHASWLCLPLPYLRCQDTYSAPSLVSPRVLYLCLPSPPWAYWDPASHEKLVVWYLMTSVIPTGLSAPSVQSNFKSTARHRQRQRCLQKTAAAMFMP
jgi:hypothetical protein